MKTAKEVALYVIAGLLFIGFFVLLGLLIFKAIPTENRDLLNLVVGTLLAGVTTVISYFFGSSKGSSDKNEMLKPKP